jgi:hypothetical protein
LLGANLVRKPQKSRKPSFTAQNSLDGRYRRGARAVSAASLYNPATPEDAERIRAADQSQAEGQVKDQVICY